MKHPGLLLLLLLTSALVASVTAINDYPSGTNVALLAAPALQSEQSNRWASNMVDGKENSVAQTARVGTADSPTWLRLLLDDLYPIGQIEIVADAAHRAWLNDTRLWVTETETYDGEPPYAQTTAELANVMTEPNQAIWHLRLPTARIVRCLWLTSRHNYISVAEFRAFIRVAQPVVTPMADPAPNTNLALASRGADARLSELFTGSGCDGDARCVAAKGNDGRYGVGAQFFHTTKGDAGDYSKPAWWRVDLKKDYNIGAIQLWNREGPVSNRVVGARVFVTNSEMVDECPPSRDDEPHTFVKEITEDKQSIFIGELNGFVGRYVWVVHPKEFLHLREVAVYGLGSTEQLDANTNLARLPGTKATHRDQYKGYTADRAIDGREDTYQHTGSSSEQKKGITWLKIELNDAYSVDRVKVLNRWDSNRWRRIRGIKVFATMTDLTTVPTETSADVVLFGQVPTNYGSKLWDMALSRKGREPIRSRYIWLTKDQDKTSDKYMYVAEVEIYPARPPLPEVPGKEVDPTKNLAKGGVASMTPAYGGCDTEAGECVASIAIDGQHGNDAVGRQVFHTSNSQVVWWRVDLRDDYVIGGIKIWNRVDCCTDRAIGARLYITSSAMNNDDIPDLDDARLLAGSIKRSQATYFFGKFNIVGRYVWAIHSNHQFLHFREVEVFGKDAVEWPGHCTNATYKPDYDYSGPAGTNIKTKYTSTVEECREWCSENIECMVASLNINKICHLKRRQAISVLNEYPGAITLVCNDHPDMQAPLAPVTNVATAPKQMNLATLNATAHQSSTSSSGDCTENTCGAHVAVDGTKDTNTFSATACASIGDFWYVDLGAVYAIEYIRIFNRKDKQSLLRGAKVYVTTRERHANLNVPPEDARLLVEPITTTVYDYLHIQKDAPMLGQFVWVVKASGDKCLHLREVEVWSSGSEVNPGHCTHAAPGTNLTDQEWGYKAPNLINSGTFASSLDECRRLCAQDTDCMVYSLRKPTTYKCYLHRGSEAYAADGAITDVKNSLSAVCNDYSGLRTIPAPIPSKEPILKNIDLASRKGVTFAVSGKSCSTSECAAENAADGNLDSSFSSECTINQYLRVDLGDNFAIGAIELSTGAASAKGVKVYLSPAEYSKELADVRDARLRVGSSKGISSDVTLPATHWIEVKESTYSTGRYITIMKDTGCLGIAEVRAWSAGSDRNPLHCDTARHRLVNSQYIGGAAVGSSSGAAATSLDACRELCKESRACQIFTFYSKDDKCYLYNKDAAFQREECDNCEAAACDDFTLLDPLPTPVVSSHPPKNTNLARTARVEISSQYTDEVLTEKNSGKQVINDGLFEAFCHTQCSRRPEWVRIDLGENFEIGRVVLHNRLDYRNRLVGARLMIVGDIVLNGKPIDPEKVPDRRFFVGEVSKVADVLRDFGDKMIGRWVWLLNDHCIHVREIEVWSADSDEWPNHCKSLSLTIPQTDFPGNDVEGSGLKTDSLEACRVECAKRLDCVLISWGAITKSCWMHNENAYPLQKTDEALTAGVCDDFDIGTVPKQAVPAASPGPNVNLASAARGATATMSGMYGENNPASLAIDGKRDKDAPFFHTKCAFEGSWLRIDLGANYEIGFVRLFNRPGFYHRLQGAVVYVVGNEEFALHPFTGAPENRQLIFAEIMNRYNQDLIELDATGPSRVGRFVYISRHNGDNCLHLREVEVWTPGSSGNPGHCEAGSLIILENMDFQGFELFNAKGHNTAVTSVAECAVLCSRQLDCNVMVLGPSSDGRFMCWLKTGDAYASPLPTDGITAAICADWEGSKPLPTVTVRPSPGPSVNLARRAGAKATISSTWGTQVRFGAHLTVDGKKDEGDLYCHSKNGDTEWLRIDLGANYEIGAVLMYGRNENRDNMRSRMVNTYVYIVPESIAGIDVSTVPTDPRLVVRKIRKNDIQSSNALVVVDTTRQPRGRYVWLVHHRQFIHLIEVEVLSPPANINPTHCSSMVEFPGIDFEGADVPSGSMWAPDMDSCRRLCQRDTRCAVFGMSGETCYLKSKQAFANKLERSWINSAVCNDFNFTLPDVSVPDVKPFVKLSADGTAMQSSTYENSEKFAAQNGIDGKTDADSPLFHTMCLGTQWWRVDLRKNYAVGMVKLFNSLTNEEHLVGTRGFVVQSGDNAQLDRPPTDPINLAFTVRQQPQDGIFVYLAPADRVLKGRYVTLVKTGNCLHLREVEVWSIGSDPYGDHCSSMVEADGPLQGVQYDGADAPYGWFNRYVPSLDTCRLKCRANPICMIFYWAPWGDNGGMCFLKTEEAYPLWQAGKKNSAVKNAYCSDWVPFDQRPKVVVDNLRDGDVGKNVNLALKKKSYSSSVYRDDGTCSDDKCVAASGNDGVMDNFFHTNDPSEQQWWRVDLGANYTIGFVRLFNRQGGLIMRVKGLKVYLTYEESKEVPSVQFLIRQFADSFDDFVEVVPPEYNNQGRVVWLVKPANDFGGWLHLREVQVWTPGSEDGYGDHCKSMTVLTETDFYHGEIADGYFEGVGDIEECRKLCRQRPECQLFAVVPYNGGQCYLKTEDAYAERRKCKECTAAYCNDWMPPENRTWPAIDTIPMDKDVNLALLSSASATMSSVYVDAGSCKAGMCDAKYGHDNNLDTFFHTLAPNPLSWWRLDLGGNYSIGIIKLFNRVDNWERVEGLRVYLTYIASSGVPSAQFLVKTVDSENKFQDHLEIDLPSYNHKGQFVWLVNGPKKFLHLREVQVWTEGSVTATHCRSIRVIPNIDFETDNFLPKSGTQVDSLDECVRLCQKEPRCFALSFGWGYCNMKDADAVGNVKPVTGQTSAVCADHPDESMDPLVAPAPEPSYPDTNLALNKPTAMSSHFPANAGDKGVDGDKSAKNFFHSECGTQGQWWRVDLGGIYRIQSIVLFNRQEEPQRIAGTRIYITTDASNAPPADRRMIVGYVASEFRRRLEIEVAGAANSSTAWDTGRYVWLVKARGDKCLHLSEVEVWSFNSDPNGAHCDQHRGQMMGIEYHSDDIRNAGALNSFDDCWAACCSEFDCFVFAYNTQNKQCYLRGARAALSKRDGQDFISAVCMDSAYIDPSNRTLHLRAIFPLRKNFAEISDTEAATALLSALQTAPAALSPKNHKTSAKNGLELNLTVDFFPMTRFEADRIWRTLRAFNLDHSGPVVLAGAVVLLEECGEFRPYGQCASSSSSDSLSSGGVAGVALAGVVVVAALVGGLYYFKLKKGSVAAGGSGSKKPGFSRRTGSDGSTTAPAMELMTGSTSPFGTLPAGNPSLSQYNVPSPTSAGANAPPLPQMPVAGSNSVYSIAPPRV